MRIRFGNARQYEDQIMKNRHGMRTPRQSKRWQKKLDDYRNNYRKIQRAAPDILKSDNFYRTKQHIQHGNVTVNDHVRDVAMYSLALSEKLHISCNREELIRGALLHDYFLYDWHTPDKVKPHRLHGFFHPGRALKNASREYKLTEREKDIIRKHMWPLTPIPPKYREAWIVTTADKWCSLMETLRLHRGHGAVLEQLRED